VEARGTWLAGWLASWLADWIAVCLAGWLAGWLAGRLAGWAPCEVNKLCPWRKWPKRSVFFNRIITLDEKNSW